MEFDYIVVGGGSAGCVTANRLSLEHRAQVLLLEGGPSDDSPLIKMPAGTFKMMFDPKSPYLRRYLSEPEATLGGRRVPIAQGSVIGGGSSVNVMAYVRGSRADYARWDAASGYAGWGWDDLLPFFTRQEANRRLHDPAHGASGPLKISDPLYVCEAAHLFVRAMQNMRVPLSSDFNAGTLDGVGYIQTTMHNGRRCSAADAFLRPLRRDPRTRIQCGAKVVRVLFEGMRAIGVEYVADGRTHRVLARNEVILTAGALATPQLLMLSGVGPAQHLRQHGIAVVADLEGVGQNLQDHHMAAISLPTTGAYGYFGQDRGWPMIRNGLRYLLFRSGPVASNGGETMAFVRLKGSGGEPDLQIYGIGMMWPEPGGHGAPMHGVSLVASLIQPKSRGQVRLRSADPFDDPVINLNWMSHPEDADKLVKGLKYLRQIAATAPLSNAVMGELRPGPHVRSDEELLAYIRETTDTNYHPVGTCRMGAVDDRTAVLTPDLRVRGVAGLRVFDASMMPTIISANTNATVMAVAEKGVAMMMAGGPPRH